MSKVTSKHQVTLPKAIARKHAIKPGDEIFFESEGESLRVRIGQFPEKEANGNRDERLKSFDDATVRIGKIQYRSSKVKDSRGKPRGWKREDLYRRGLSR